MREMSARWEILHVQASVRLHIHTHLLIPDLLNVRIKENTKAETALALIKILK